MNKYCTKMKVRVSIGETRSSHCQRIMPLPRQMFLMQCSKYAVGLSEKVLYLCSLLIDISGSLEILNNISVILHMKK